MAENGGRRRDETAMTPTHAHISRVWDLDLTVGSRIDRVGMV